MKKKHISRRKFIGQTGLGMLGASALLSPINPLRALGSAAAINSGNSRAPYKAMVCLLLSGGNDSFNMLTMNMQSHAQIWPFQKMKLYRFPQ